MDITELGDADGHVIEPGDLWLERLPTDLRDFGLEPPAGTLVVTTARGTQRLALGKLNAAGSAVYARRGVEPRVLQVGVYVLETVERVLAPDDEHAARRYRPEIG